MGTRSSSKLVSRIGIMLILLLMLIAESGVTQAIGGPVLSITATFNQGLATVGNTPLLTINVTSTDGNRISNVSVYCTQFGNSLTHNSINNVPSTISPNGSFTVTQLYRANVPGVTQLNCSVTGIDTITHGGVGATSGEAGVNVLSETRLYMNATSGTHVATVGQAFYIDIPFGNQGKTPFTNVGLSCNEPVGPIVLLELQTATPSNTLPAGQSGFIQYRGFATSPGTLSIQCSINATDSDGKVVNLTAPVINITVK
jgi:hypothetical protein